MISPHSVSCLCVHVCSCKSYVLGFLLLYKIGALFCFVKHTCDILEGEKKKKTDVTRFEINFLLQLLYIFITA